MPGPGGVLLRGVVPGLGSVCSGGVPGPRGCLLQGVPGLRGGIPAFTEADPQSRWLLLRTVRILLECILFLFFLRT